MKVFINESILIPGNIWEPKDKIDFENNLKQIIDSIKCFGFFDESQLYFYSSGIKKLLEDLHLVDGVEEYFLSDIIVQFREAIKKYNAIDWSQNQSHRNDFNYLVQLGEGFTPIPSNGTSIAEACEYKYQGKKTLLLNFLSSEFNGDSLINIVRGDTKPPKDMTLVKIDCLSEKSTSIRYYLQNREIAYTHNDKHGENHELVKEKISPLKCKIEVAAKLLQISIGHKKSDKLFAYDFDRNEFIEFKYDNTENPKGYHGYHPHDQKIPTDIEKFLNDNKEIFKIENDIIMNKNL